MSKTTSYNFLLSKFHISFITIWWTLVRRLVPLSFTYVRFLKFPHAYCTTMHSLRTNQLSSFNSVTNEMKDWYHAPKVTRFHWSILSKVGHWLVVSSASRCSVQTECVCQAALLISAGCCTHPDEEQCLKRWLPVYELGALVLDASKGAVDARCWIKKLFL